MSSSSSSSSDDDDDGGEEDVAGASGDAGGDDVNWDTIQEDEECVLVFLLFFSFWCFMPKGEKIRGVNNLSMPWRGCCSRSFMFYPMRVVFIW